VALLGLVDWLGYRHLVTHGYDHTVFALAALNVGIFVGIYYLVLRPLQQRIQRRRMARAVRQQRLQSSA
jgi:preprotein translocase subunit YajC